jgi:hypothetical protein
LEEKIWSSRCRKAYTNKLTTYTKHNRQKETCIKQPCRQQTNFKGDDQTRGAAKEGWRRDALSVL